MTFNELISDTIKHTMDTSLPAFGPELTLCITIFAILLVRVLPGGEKIDSFYLALLGSIVALSVPWGGQPWKLLGDEADIARTEIFSGMLVYDGLTLFMRGLLLFFVVLLIPLIRLTSIFDRRDGPDFYTLILGATLGMCLMAAANHLLIVFLAVEMASVPSYVLAGMRKTRRQSSEAALKYSVYGAGAAGVMLYGISLVAGILNTVHLPTVATRLVAQVPGMEPEQLMVLALGGLMIMVGLAFKLSAVPFHFWCPDVFEGASAEVNAFLSVASKAAALALLVRVALGVGVAIPSGPESAVTEPAVAMFNLSDEDPDEAAVDPHTPELAPPAPAGGPDGSEGAADGAAQVQAFIAILIAFVAAITCTFGNLAAYAQTNINRLLAYSTIAHAGYMMMPVPAAVVVAGTNPEAAEVAISSLLIYMGIYLFMNLGAFAIVAVFRGALGSEEIDDYGGLVRRAPIVVICLSLILFSLVGLPPLAGFVGKFAVFAALVDGYEATGAAYLMALLVVGGLNTALSLFYYLRVVKVMTIDPEPETRTGVEFSLVSLSGAYVVLVSAPIIVLFFAWNWLSTLAERATDHLLS